MNNEDRIEELKARLNVVMNELDELFAPKNSMNFGRFLDENMRLGEEIRIIRLMLTKIYKEKCYE